MTSIFSGTQRFMQDEQGVTAIEYGLIAALIAVALVGTIKTVTTALDGTFTSIKNALTS
jgi:pilus assembly protein Flp/PilA